MFSTLWESRCYRISFVACRAEALAKAGQGFAVVYYSFTLDAADLPDERDLRTASSTFAALGLFRQDNPAKV
jgi:hypothetical protein